MLIKPLEIIQSDIKVRTRVAVQAKAQPALEVVTQFSGQRDPVEYLNG